MLQKIRLWILKKLNAIPLEGHTLIKYDLINNNTGGVWLEGALGFVNWLVAEKKGKQEIVICVEKKDESNFIIYSVFARKAKNKISLNAQQGALISKSK